MSVFAGPATGVSPSQGNLLLSIDFANTKTYPGSGSTITNSIAGYNFTLSNPSFYSFDSATNSMNFTRDSVTVSGGYAGLYSPASSSPLYQPTYLYNNHTSEILARINTIQSGYQEYPAVYNSTNINGLLAGYTGYHTMFLYSSSSLNYHIWDGTNAPTYADRATSGLTVGTSGTQVVQGQWFHIVVTRNSNTFKTYLNGKLMYTDTFVAATPSPSNNNLLIGAAAVGASYSSYTKSNVALLRMYNTVLTDDQVAQNFVTIRGRYGI
jgi:hypothetical protein